jgi:O-antigen ligase
VQRWPRTAAAHVLGVSLLLAVLAALPVAPSDLDRHQFPKETLAHLGVFLAVLLVRPWPLLDRRRALQLGACVLVGWSIVTAVLATNPWLGWRAAALTATALVAFGTAHALARAGAGPIILAWVALAAVAGAATGLAQALGAEHPFFSRLRAPGGTFGNRNFLAHLAAAALPLLAWMMLQARRRVGVVLAAVGIAAMSAGLVLTRSRAGWLAAIAGIATMAVALVLARRGAGVPLRPRRVLLLGVMLGAGAVLAIVTPNTLEWRSDSPYSDTLGNLANYREGSGRGRLLQYQNTLELVRRHPVFGVGAGNWALHYGEVAPRGDPSFASNDVVPLNPWPSSDWLAVASERGAPAVLAIILLGVAVLWRALGGIRAGGDRAVAGATLAATVAALGVAGLFDAVLLLAIPAYFAALACGALLAAADGDSHDGVPARSPRAALLVLLVALGLARSAMQTTAYLTAGNGASRARLARAAVIDPFSYQLRIRLARGPCRTSRDHARAAVTLAPTWPAARAAARRCGIRDG